MSSSSLSSVCTPIRIGTFRLVIALCFACSDRPRPTASPVQPSAPGPDHPPTILPACARSECDPLCSRDARDKLFWRQPTAMSDAEADCFACVVNAISMCDSAVLALDGVWGLAVSARALDLVKLPHEGTDEVALAPLETSPSGQPEQTQPSAARVDEDEAIAAQGKPCGKDIDCVGNLVCTDGRCAKEASARATEAMD